VLWSVEADTIPRTVAFVHREALPGARLYHGRARENGGSA